MTRKSEILASANYFLKPGYILVANQPTVISTVLGSCVAVCLYDRKRKVGGMNHFQLPSISRSEGATARYGNVATLALIGMMIEDGSKVKNLEAQIFGGAFNREVSDKDVGRENIRVARRILARKGIRLVSEDVGGEKGRKIVYDTSTNEVAVMRVDKLRRGDWHPYKDDR
ncbi:MAG: chemotaxis protein CheD [Deltaproteobacteria bacterium]|nr:chemotaxis protein CheD [Deltaproteobacteria bacterium]MBW2017363.1 chemotaxis protein CheD [Deltaproteobacteria bacterium]MBW2128233.1 chemotaxis protein CheD [Deltaproteobacteria bacterium]MBW2303237.1 chemotaxis protein CheD [Deltaproteobacteria bacterium]